MLIVLSQFSNKAFSLKAIWSSLGSWCNSLGFCSYLSCPLEGNVTQKTTATTFLNWTSVTVAWKIFTQGNLAGHEKVIIAPWQTSTVTERCISLARICDCLYVEEMFLSKKTTTSQRTQIYTCHVKGISQNRSIDVYANAVKCNC